MAPEHPVWGEGWAAGVRVWVERAGKAILGKGRLELLEGIDRQQSISAAARAMNMSYRRAWLLVQEINEAAGELLVTATTGGTHGGGAQLTPQGKWAVAVYREFQEQLRQTAASLLQRLVHRDTAPCLHILAAASLEEVLRRALADFALQRPDLTVRTVFGASDELAEHVLAGAPADLFLSADPAQLDRLTQALLVRAEVRCFLAENGLVALARSGWSGVVRRSVDLCDVPPGRLALADIRCPLGGYTRAYLEGEGLDKSLKKAIRGESSRAVLALLQSGRADVALTYASDATHAEGCRVLLRLRHPALAIRYEAALLERGMHPEETRILLEFLTSAKAGEHFRRCGFLVPKSKRR